MVYSCLEDKMYKARRGKGAFCNDEPIQVSDVEGEFATLRYASVLTANDRHVNPNRR